MCLTTDIALHPRKRKADGSYNPMARRPCRIAERDILVYKVLDYAEGNYAWSPFRGSRWTFGKMRNSSIANEANKYSNIERGLHAYTDAARAGTTLTLNNYSHSYYSDNRSAVYPAIIPKGSKVYFGQRGDIATNNMIVFKDLKSLEAVYGKIGNGVLKRNIAK